MYRTIAATTACLFAALPALADMSQPTQDMPSVWAYPQAENYCPAGLQPVRLGGVVCCGKPTHTGYGDAPAARPSYVAYGKGADDYVAYSKSPGVTE